MDQRNWVVLVQIFFTTLLSGVASQVTTNGDNDPDPEPPNNFTFTIPEGGGGGEAVKYARYNSGPTTVQRSETIAFSGFRSEPTSFANSQSLPMQTIRFSSNPGEVMRYTLASGSSNGGGQQQSVDPLFRFPSQAAADQTASSRTMQPQFIPNTQQNAQRSIVPQGSYNYFAGQGVSSMASGNVQRLSESNLPPFQSAKPVSRTIRYLTNPNSISIEQASSSLGSAPSEYDSINQLKTGDFESNASNADVRNSQLGLAYSSGELTGYSQHHPSSPDSRPSKLQDSHDPDTSQEPPIPSDSSNPAISISPSSAPTGNGRPIINGHQVTQNKSTEDSSQEKSHNINDSISDANDSQHTMGNQGRTGETEWHDSPEAEDQKSFKHLSGERSSSDSSVAVSTISQRSADTPNSTSPNSLGTTNSTQPPGDDTSAPNYPISKDKEQLPQQLVLNKTSELSPNSSSSGNNPRGQVGTILPKVDAGARDISFSQTSNMDGKPLPEAFKAVQDPSQLTLTPSIDPYTSNRPMGDMSSSNPTDIPGNMNPRLPIRQHPDTTYHHTFDGGLDQRRLKNFPNNFNGGPNTFSSSPNVYPDGQGPPPFIKMNPQPDSYVSIIPEETNSPFPGVQLIGESFRPGTFQFNGTIGFWSSYIPILFGGKPISIVTTNGRTQSSEPSFQNVSPNFPGFFISSRDYNSLRSSLFPTNTIGQLEDNIDTFSSIKGQEPQTRNTPTTTTTGQSATKMPALPNNFNPSTSTTPGSMFLFSTPQNQTNNMSGSDILYLFPISFRFNIPSGVRLAGKIKYPTPESEIMRPLPLSFNPISTLSQPGTRQDPSLGANLTPIFRLATSIPLSAVRSTTKPFDATGTLNIINYGTPENPSDSVTPDPLSSGHSAISGSRNLPGRPIMGFTSKPFNLTTDPLITNYGNPYYDNPNNGYPYFDNPEHTYFSGTPLVKSNFFTIPERPRPWSTNEPFGIIGIPGITRDVNPNYGNPNNGYPNHGHPNYGYSKYDNPKDPSISQITNNFPLLNPTMPASSIFPGSKGTGSPTNPFDIAYDNDPNYVNPNYENGNPNYRYPEYDNSKNPSVFWAIDDSFPQHGALIPTSRKIPGRQETRASTKPYDSTGTPDIIKDSNLNYENPNRKNPKYGSPENPSVSGTLDSVPQRDPTMPGTRNIPERQMTATGTPDMTNNDSPNYGKPNNDNPSNGNPNYGNQNYGNSIYKNPNNGNLNYENPNYLNPNYGNPNNGNPNYENPNYWNPNYWNPKYGLPENPSIFETLDSISLLHPTMPGTREIPGRPTTATETPDITNDSNPTYGDSSYGNPNYGSPNNGNPNNRNPRYGNPNYGNQNDRNQNYGSPNNGNPTYRNLNYGNPNYGTPNYENPNYGNTNNKNPKYGNPNYGNPSDGNPNYENPENLTTSGKLDSFPLRDKHGSRKIPERPITATGTPDITNDSNPNFVNHYGNPNNGNPNYEYPEKTSISGKLDSFPLRDPTMPDSPKNPVRSITATGTPDNTNDSIPNTKNLKYDNPENPTVSGTSDSIPGTRKILERPMTATGTPDIANDRNPNYVNHYGNPNNGDPNNGNPYNSNPNYGNPGNPSLLGTLDSFPLSYPTRSGSRMIPERPKTAGGTPDITNDKNPNYVSHHGNPNNINPNNGKPSYGNPIYGNPNDGKSNYGNPNYGYPNNGNPNYGNPENPSISGALNSFLLRDPTPPGSRKIPERPITVDGNPTYVNPNNGNPSYGNPIYGNPNDGNTNYGYPNNGNPENPSISGTLDSIPGTRKILKRPMTVTGTPDIANDKNPNYVNHYRNPNNGNPNYGNPGNPSLLGTLDSFPLSDPTRSGSRKISERPITADGNPTYVNPNNGNPSYENPIYGNPNDGNPNYGYPINGNPENHSISGTLDSIPGTRKILKRPTTVTGTPDIANDKNPNYVNHYGNPNNGNPNYGNPGNPSRLGTLDSFPLSEPTISGSRKISERPITADGNPTYVNPNNGNPSYENPIYGNPNDGNPNYGYPNNGNPENPSISGTLYSIPGTRKILERPMTATGTPDIANDKNPNYVNHYGNPNNGNPNDGNPNYGNPGNPSLLGTLDSFPLSDPTRSGSRKIPERPITASVTPDIPNDKNPNYVNHIGNPNNRNPNNGKSSYGNPIYGNPNGGNPNYGYPNNGNPNYGNPKNPSILGTLYSFLLRYPTTPGSRKIPERPITSDGNPTYVNPNNGNPNNGNPSYRNPIYGNLDDGNPNIDNPNYGNPENSTVSGTLDSIPGTHKILERPMTATGTPDIANDETPNNVNHHGNPNNGDPNNGNPNNSNPNYGNPNYGYPNYGNPENPSISGTLDSFPLRDPTMPGSRKISERPITATGTPDITAYDNPTYVNPIYGNPGNPSLLGTLDSFPLSNPTRSGTRKILERPMTATGTPDITNDKNPNYVNHYGNPNNGNPSYDNPIYGNRNDGNPNYGYPNYGNPGNPSISGTLDSFPLRDPTMPGSRKISERPITASGTPDITAHGNPTYVNPNNGDPNYGHANDRKLKHDNPGNLSISETLDSFPLRHPTLVPGSSEIPETSITATGSPDITKDSDPNYVNPNYRNPNYTNPNNRNPKFDNPGSPSISGTLDSFPQSDPTMSGSRKIPERPITATGTPDITNDSDSNYVNPDYRNPNYSNPYNMNPKFDNPGSPSTSGTLDSFPKSDPTRSGFRKIPERPITATETPDITTDGNPNYVNPNYRNPNNGHPNNGDPNYVHANNWNLKHDNPGNPSISETLDSFPLRHPTPVPGSSEIPERSITATGSPDITKDSDPNYVNPNYRNPNYTNPNNRNPKFDNPGSPSISGTLDSLPQSDPTMSGSRKIPERPITAIGTPDITADSNPNYVNPNYGNPNHRNQKYYNPGNPSISETLDSFPLHHPTLMSGSRGIPERPISAIGADITNDSDPNYINPKYRNPYDRNPNYSNPNNRNLKFDNSENPSVSGTLDSFPQSAPTRSGSRKIPERPITATGTPDITNDSNPNDGNPNYSNQNYGNPNYANPYYENPNYGNPNFGSPNNKNPNYGIPNYGNPNPQNPNYGYPYNPSIPGTLDSITLRDLAMPGSGKIPKWPITGSPKSFAATGTPDITNNSDPNHGNPNYGNPNYVNPNDKNPNDVQTLYRYPKYDTSVNPSISGTLDSFPQDPTMIGSRKTLERPITGTPTKPLDTTGSPDITNDSNPNYVNPIYGNRNPGNPDSSPITMSAGSFPLQKSVLPAFQNVPDRSSMGSPGELFNANGTPDIKYNYGNPKYEYPNNGSPERPSNFEGPETYPLGKSTIPGSLDLPIRPITGSPTTPFGATGKLVTTYENPTYDYPENPASSGIPDNFLLQKFNFSGSRNFLKRPIMGSPTKPFDATGTPEISNNANPNHGNPNYENPNDGYPYYKYPNYDNPRNPLESGTPDSFPSRKSRYHSFTIFPQQTIIGSPANPFDSARTPDFTSNAENPKYGNSNYVNPNNSNTKNSTKRLPQIPWGKFTIPGFRRFLENPIMGSANKQFDPTGTPDFINGATPDFTSHNPTSSPNGGTDVYTGEQRNPVLRVNPLTGMGGIQPGIQYIRKKYPLGYQFGTQPDLDITSSDNPNQSLLNSLPIEQPFSGSRMNQRANPTTNHETQQLPSNQNPFDYNKLPSSSTIEASLEPSLIGQPNGYEMYLTTYPANKNTAHRFVKIPAGGSPDPSMNSSSFKPGAQSLNPSYLVSHPTQPDVGNSSSPDSLTLESNEPTPSIRKDATSLYGGTYPLNLDPTDPSKSTLHSSTSQSGQLEVQPNMSSAESNPYNPTQRSSGSSIEAFHLKDRSIPMKKFTDTPTTDEQQSVDFNRDTKESKVDSPKPMNQPGQNLPGRPRGTATITVIPNYAKGSTDPETFPKQRPSNTYQPPTNNDTSRSIRYYPANTRSDQTPGDQPTLEKQNIGTSFVGEQPRLHNLTNIDQSPNYPTLPSGQLNLSNPSLHNPSETSSKEQIDANSPESAADVKHYRTRQNHETPEPIQYSSLSSQAPGERSASDPLHESQRYIINKKPGESDTSSDTSRISGTTITQSSNTQGSIHYYPGNILSDTTLDRSAPEQDNIDPTNDNKTHGAHHTTKQYTLPNYETILSSQVTDSSDPSPRLPPEPSSKEKTDDESPDSTAITYYRTGERSGMPGSIQYYSTNSLPGQTPGERSATDPRYGGQGYIINKLQGASGTSADTTGISGTTTIQSSNTPGSIKYYPGNIKSNHTTGERSASYQDNVDPTNNNKAPGAYYITKQNTTYSSPHYQTRPSTQLMDSSDPSSRFPSEPSSKEQIDADSTDGADIAYYRTMPGSIRYYSPKTLSGLTPGERSTTGQDNVGPANDNKIPIATYITKQYTVPNYPTQLSHQLTNSSDPSFEPSSKDQIDADSPDSAVNHIRTGQRTAGSIRYYQSNILPDQDPGELSTSDSSGGQTYIMNKQPGASDTTSDTSRISGRTIIQTSTTRTLSQGSINDEGIDGALVRVHDETISSENLEAGKIDSGLTLEGQMKETQDSARPLGSPLTKSSGISYRIGTSFPVYGSATDSTAGKSISYDSVAQATNMGSYSGNISPSVKMIPATQSQSQVTGSRYMITNPASSITTKYSTGPIFSSSGTSTVHHQYFTQPITTQVRYSVVPAAYRQISGTQNGQAATSTYQPSGEMKSMIPLMSSLPKGMKAGVTRGKYSYTGPDGKTVTTNWYVDETGFHIDGDQNAKTLPEDTKTS